MSLTYGFIIDFLEADSAPEAMEASAKPLEWWNRYVSRVVLPQQPLTSAPQSGIPDFSRLCVWLHPYRHIKNHSQPCDCNVRPPTPPNRPRSFRA